MKVLVTGVNGQLGYDVCRVLQAQGIEHLGVDIDDFDITDATATLKFVDGYNPDVIVHCAAYTAVDKAEDNKELCRKVNVVGTQNLAVAANNVDAKFMYISTDYVFDGFSKDTVWEIDDPKQPQNYYGLSKYEGEQSAQVAKKLFILRICWVFGKNGNNFVKTMLRLSETKTELNVVNDQQGAPTYTYDAAKLIADMIKTTKYGVYHACNEGYCTWYEFALEIFKQAGVAVKVNPITSAQFPTPAKRPKNSKLSLNSLDDAGFRRLPSWQDALSRYLSNE